MHDLAIGIATLVFAILVSALQVRFAVSGVSSEPRKDGCQTNTSRANGAAETHPHPVWEVNNYGVVTWANKSARAFNPRLFTSAQSSTPHVETKRRICIRSDAKPDAWLDITAIPTTTGVSYYATPADSEIAAHRNRQEFVTSLANTFAQLSTGLAIFNRQRCLVSFNPALLDMTGLDFATLSTRPDLFSFMDALRDMGIFPEPKNYPAWRERLDNLTQQNSTEQFQDLWCQPHGETIRVTGKPHSDGTIVFLFEDITKETLQVRRHRYQVDQFTHAFNRLNIGVALFDEGGACLHINEKCLGIWGLDQTRINQNLGIRDYTRIWRIRSKAGGFWTEINHGQEYQKTVPPHEIELQTGDTVIAQLIQLPLQAKMVTFEPCQKEISAISLARA